MRTLNLRLLAILLVAGLAIGVASHWLHGFQMRRHASFFLEQAHLAEAEGRENESLNHYQQYLRVQPDDLEARAQYGLLLSELGIDGQASSCLEKVLRRSPDSSDIRKELVRIWMRTGQTDDAIEHLNRLLRSEPGAPELLTLRGQCQTFLGQYNAAAKSFQDVLGLTEEEFVDQPSIEIRAEQIDACAFLAELCDNRLDRADQADWLMTCLAESEFPRAHILLGRLWRARSFRPGGSIEHIEQALKQAEEAVRLASQDIAACTPRALLQCVLAPKAAPTDGPLGANRHEEEPATATVRLISLAAQARAGRMLAAYCAMRKGDNEVARRHAEHVRKSIVPRDSLRISLRRIDPSQRNAQGRALLASTVGLPSGVDVYAMLARLERLDGRIDEAIEWYVRGLEFDPKNRDLRWELALLLIGQERISEAEVEVQELSNEGHSMPLVNYLRATIDIAEGNQAAAADETALAKEQWLSAIDVLEEIRDVLPSRDVPTEDVDNWLGVCFGHLRDAEEDEKLKAEYEDKEQEAYDRVIAADSDDARPRIAFANKHGQAMQWREAYAELREIWKITGESFTGWLNLARFSVLSMQDKAEDRENAPAPPSWSEIDRVFSEAIKHLDANSPDGIQVRTLYFNVLGQRPGQDAKAKALFEKAREEASEVLAYRVGLAFLAGGKGNWQRTEQALDDIEQGLGGQVDSLIELRLTQARLLITRDRESEDEAVLGPRGLDVFGDGAESLPAPDRRKLWLALLVVALQTNESNGATFLCERILEADPGDLDVLLQRFILAHEAKDVPAMDEAVAAIQGVEGSEATWHYTQALRLIFPVSDTGDQAKETEEEEVERFKTARDHVEKAKEARPGWPPLVYLDAVIDDATGDPESALAKCLEAIELGMKTDAALIRASRLLLAAGRSPEAYELLNRVSNERNQASLGLGTVESRIRFSADDFAGALDAARKAAKDSEEYDDHLWLAFSIQRDLLRETPMEPVGDLLKEQEETLRSALKIDPEAWEAWAMLVECLANLKQTDKAQQAIADAKENLENLSPEKAPFALAVCHRILKNYAEAESYYQEALDLTNRDSALLRNMADFYQETNNPSEAERYWRKLIDPATQAPEADLDQARRSLVILLAARASGPGVGSDDATRLLDEAIELNKHSSTSDFKLRKAILLASYPDESKQREAVQLFEEMLARDETLPTQAWFNLATLYHQTLKEPAKAIKVLEDLLSRDETPSAETNYHLGGLYLESGNLPKATEHLYAAVLAEGKGENRLRYIPDYVEALLRSKEPGKAEDWIARLRELAPNEWVTAAFTARAQFQREQFDDAVASIEGFAGRGSAELARLALLRKFASTLIDPEQEPTVGIDDPSLTLRCLASFAHALLRNNQPKQAEPWIARLEQLEPDKVSTFTFRAESLFQQGEFDRVLETLTNAAEKPGLDATEQTTIRRLALAQMHSFSQRLAALENQEATAEKFRVQAEAVSRALARQNPEDELILARLLAQQGKLEEAIDAVERGWSHADAIALATVLGGLTTIKASDDQLQRIEAIATQALENNQRSRALLGALALIHTNQDRFSEVEAIYREILAENADDVATANNLAVLLALKGTELDEAQRLIDHAIELEGDDPILLDSRATVYLARNQPSEALADLARAIAAQPRPTRYFHQAQAYLQLGRKPDAAAAMQQAENLGLQPAQLHRLEAPALAEVLETLRSDR